MRDQPIDELNKCVSQFIDEVRSDEMAAVSIELGIVAVGKAAREEMPITPMLQVDLEPKFEAYGPTPLGGAVEMALNMLDNRKQKYKSAGVPYYQPWLVIISNGTPTDDWQSVAARAKKLEAAKKLVVMPVCIGSTGIDALSQFSNKPVMALDGLKFKEFFAWLSASMSSVLRSATTSKPLLPANSWSAISENAPSVPRLKPSEISLEVSFEVPSSSKVSFKALFEVPSPDEQGSNRSASEVLLSPTNTWAST